LKLTSAAVGRGKRERERVKKKFLIIFDCEISKGIFEKIKMRFGKIKF
jgi:hypothetical protein